MTRILLVDDDPDILDIMQLELEDDGKSTVDTCRSAREALERVDTAAYDVIISDLHMPGMDGTDLVRELRNRKCSSFIIIYSGHDLGDGIRKALASGADHYLARNGDPEREFPLLKTLIKKAMEEK
jgi:two-component system CheB/CheR fusion protein